MFHLAVDLQVYLHREAVDFRKGINGLAALVEQSLQRDPFARAVYASSNRRRDRVNRARKWIPLQTLLNQRSEPINAFAKIHSLTVQIHLQINGQMKHRRAPTFQSSHRPTPRPDPGTQGSVSRHWADRH